MIKEAGDIAERSDFDDGLSDFDQFSDNEGDEKGDEQGKKLDSEKQQLEWL